MSNPWDIYPREPTGDQTPEPLFQELGRALTQWEILEQVLAALYGEIIQSTGCGAEAGYGTLISPEARTWLLRSAIDAVFKQPTELNTKLNMLINHIGKLRGRRNDVGHGVVAIFTTDTKTYGYYLVPPSYQTRKQIALTFADIDDDASFLMGTHKYAYTASQVSAYARSFEEYRDKIFKLTTQDVRKRRRELHGI